MSQVGKNRLDTGDTFPTMTLSLARGSSMTIPDDLGDGLSVVLLYRGEW